jgi:hypothetical protein
MKKLLFIIPVLFVFYSCGNFTKEKAADMITQKHSFPRVFEMDYLYDFVVPISGNIAALTNFPGVQISDDDLKLITGFSTKGLIKLDDKIMTGYDPTVNVGDNVIKWHHYTASFTDEGKKYFLGEGESEVNSPRRVTRVKLYDEQLGQVTAMIEKEPGKSFEVHYTVVRVNATPFLDVYRDVFSSNSLYNKSIIVEEIETIVKGDDGWKIE